MQVLTNTLFGPQFSFSQHFEQKYIFESVHREGISEFICHPCQKSFSNSSNLQWYLTATLHSEVDKWQKAKRQSLPTSSSTSANVG